MKRRLHGRAAVVFGTRPEIIKLAPVLRELGDTGRPVFTGQHFDNELTRDIMRSCGLPTRRPDLCGVGGAERGEQIATMIGGLTGMFRNDRPDVVVVQGDTNTASAAAQSAHYLGIPVVHVEAGLRSGDRSMPEEINRCMIAVVADVHCAATPGNVANLLAMGVDRHRVHLTGNPVIEAVEGLLPDLRLRRQTLDDLGVRPGDYVLATIHRPGNTDDVFRLRDIVDGLARLNRTVVFPAHPRTIARIREFGIDLAPRVRLLAPVDYLTFLTLTAEAALIVSDSGGVQEEATVLRRPLVVVRPTTERPEAVEAGFADLCEPDGIPDCARRMINKTLPDGPSPFGDGRAAARIAQLVAGLARDRPGPACVSGVGRPPREGPSARPHVASRELR